MMVLNQKVLSNAVIHGDLSFNQQVPVTPSHQIQTYPSDVGNSQPGWVQKKYDFGSECKV